MMLLSSRYELASDDRDETCVDGDVCVVWEDDACILGRYAYHFGGVLVDQELLSRNWRKEALCASEIHLCAEME